MNNQARASRHASGILPSKQFFAPRKPITALSRRKSALSVVGNSPNTPPSPGAQSVTTNNRSTLNSVINSQLLNFNSEDEVSLLQQPSSLALAAFSSQTSSNNNNNLSLDQSIDNIFSPDASATNRTSLSKPPSALLLRRQQRQQNGEGGSTELSQAVINSVLEPIIPAPVLEPSSYRQLMRQATLNAGSDLSSKDFAAATAYSKHSDISPNTPSSNTKLTEMSSKKFNSSQTKQPTFNIKYPRIMSPHSSTDHKGQRLYQVWPGRNRFFLGGRIMTSRDFPAFLVAFSALVVPSGLFMGFTCPFLFHQVSPAVVFIFVYLFLLAVTSMLRTSWSDPGIVPRNLDPSPPTECVEDPENAQNNPNIDVFEPARSFPLPKEVRINGQTVRLKYCETCKIYRPPRCSHCRQCDNCVENEDHHCIWLNNCIGRRNYRTFFTFIATATILCIYVLGFCLAHLLLLMKKSSNFLDAIMDAPVSFLLIVLSFVLMWSVGGLTGYHIYLISNNLTTHEQIRVPMARRNNRNPFDYRNVFRNCLSVLCRPMSPSSVSRRAYVNKQDINTHGFNEGVRSTVIAGDLNNNNTLGECDIRVDIKEVITVNNSDEGLNALRQNNNENNNIKEDTEVSLSPNLPVPSIKINDNVSFSNEKEQVKEPQMTEVIITTESS